MSYDLKISVNDTVEIDTIIKQSDTPMNPISRVERTNDGTNYINSLEGFQTNTVIFDPPESGDYEIDINGQTLSIKVTETSSVPSISMFQDPKMHFYAGSLVSDVSSWVDEVSNISASSSGSPSYNGELSGFETVDVDGDYYQFNTSTVSGSSYSCVALLQLDSLPTGAGILGWDSSVFTARSNSTLTIDYNGDADPSKYGNLTTGDFITIGFAIDSSTVEFYLNGTSVGSDGGISNIGNFDSGSQYILESSYGSRPVDGKISEIIICDSKEPSSSFSEFHNDRLG